MGATAPNISMRDWLAGCIPPRRRLTEGEHDSLDRTLSGRIYHNRALVEEDEGDRYAVRYAGSRPTACRNSRCSHDLAIPKSAFKSMIWSLQTYDRLSNCSENRISKILKIQQVDSLTY